jgi:hypothetical protein
LVLVSRVDPDEHRVRGGGTGAGTGREDGGEDGERGGSCSTC